MQLEGVGNYLLMAAGGGFFFENKNQRAQKLKHNAGI
jgi:hypothetical protein